MRIEQLENHYVLCGFGRVGQEIARELRERGVDFVVMEQTPKEVERARAFGYLVIAGLTAGQLIAGASNATFLGIRHRTGILEVGPRNDSILHDGDVAIVLAEEADIAAMLAPAKGGRP